MLGAGGGGEGGGEVDGLWTGVCHPGLLNKPAFLSSNHVSWVLAFVGARSQTFSKVTLWHNLVTLSLKGGGVEKDIFNWRSSWKTLWAHRDWFRDTLCKGFPEKSLSQRRVNPLTLNFWVHILKTDMFETFENSMRLFFPGDLIFYSRTYSRKIIEKINET